MNRTIPTMLLTLCVGCGGGPPPSSEAIEVVPTGDTSSAAMASDAGSPAGPPVEPDVGKRLTERIDIELPFDEPVEIDALGLTVTLLSARSRRATDPSHGWVHGRQAVVRFERRGEAPFDVTFGPRRDTYELFGHDFAIFGGTELSIFPPGVPAYP